MFFRHNYLRQIRRNLGNPPPPNEALRTQRARLLFQSRKHGLKELEFIFKLGSIFSTV